MSVQTFNPTDLSQSTANWAVAQRIVGPFAPHAQVSPDLTIALDPGYLLNGTTLTEVKAQVVGPFAAPASGFRIDRVVVDCTTGAATVVTGTANNLTPPPIPAGTLPVARVFLENATLSLNNKNIVDERALVNQKPIDSLLTCRATRGGNAQANIPSNSYTKILFNTESFNVGSGFDISLSRFKPSKEGYYQVTLSCFMNVLANRFLQAAIYKNGSGISVGTSVTSVQIDHTASVSDTVYMNGTTDYLEGYVYHNNGTQTNLHGHTEVTFFTASLIR